MNYWIWCGFSDDICKTLCAHFMEEVTICIASSMGNFKTRHSQRPRTAVHNILTPYALLNLCFSKKYSGVKGCLVLSWKSDFGVHFCQSCEGVWRLLKIYKKQQNKARVRTHHSACARTHLPSSKECGFSPGQRLGNRERQKHIFSKIRHFRSTTIAHPFSSLSQSTYVLWKSLLKSNFLLIGMTRY